jgi:cephalosporin hydroxylase
MFKRLYALYVPRWLASWIARRRDHLRVIDLRPVRVLRSVSVAALQDVESLEQILPTLGLVASRSLVPASLHRYLGTGLWHWQHPKQFAPYLAKIGTLPISSYLEIGVKYGGTFVITVEYLSRFREIRRAVGVDANFCPSLVRYQRMNPRARFVQINTRDPRFERLVRDEAWFDLVLIDGDHEEEGCWKDFELVRSRSNVLVFHDIVNEFTPGPGRVWRKVKEICRDELDFYEFTDQYPEIRASLGKTVLGLGLAVRKNWVSVASK